MELFWYWLIFGIAICIAEIAVGHAYLLAVGVAFVETSIISHSGASLELQLSAVIFLALSNIIVLRCVHYLFDFDGSAEPSEVRVICWNDDGTAKVEYSGREWLAELFLKDMPKEAVGYVRAINGDKLIISTISAQ